jgi:GrpB-like predicted nucleotidyltransferase (UPF0157 family)
MPHLGLLSDRVLIVDYDACWPGLFAKEAKRIKDACGAVEIEHVGSTAVPGLAAKPILDLMIGVMSFSEAAGLVPLIEALGYVFLGTYGIEGRLFFRSPEPCTHHLHIVEKDGQFWQDEILFRNYLRDHPVAGAAYVALKRELAIKFANDRPSYTEAKGEFILTCLSHARGRAQAANE